MWIAHDSTQVRWEGAPAVPVVRWQICGPTTTTAAETLPVLAKSAVMFTKQGHVICLSNRCTAMDLRFVSNDASGLTKNMLGSHMQCFGSDHACNHGEDACSPKAVIDFFRVVLGCSSCKSKRLNASPGLIRPWKEDDTSMQKADN